MIELGSGDYSSHVNGQGHILSILIKLTFIFQTNKQFRKKGPLFIWRENGKKFSPHKRESTQGIHPGFETQGRRHQKSKTGVSVAPRKGLCSYCYHPRT